MTTPSAHLIPLTCPSCGASIKVADGAGRYTCGYCGNEHLFVAPAVPAAAPAAAPVANPAIRPRVPTPASVRIVKDGQGAVIIQRWFSWKYLPMAFFAVFWDAFLIFWYSMALSTGAPTMAVLFPLIHVAVGVGITYTTLCGFLNRTNVELTRAELAVWFEPLPWPGEKTIKTAEIKQLYCKETISRGRRSTRYHYQLCAVTQDDREVKLVTNLDSPDIARFFEQQLEGWLKIEDQPVEGEFGRG
ncbi:MAG: hypothetical protein EHM21_11600 [Chloroflexi bacterium]|nr:MAG: hypothetical protein EHM21_11600 [Chloroflexota bacterium]